MTTRAIWTIGHSNLSFEEFVALLTGEGIEVVVDVRSYPYSRFAPQFNREAVQGVLHAHGVRYLFLGDELGGRPAKEEHYDSDGHALYGPMSEEPEFGRAISRVIEGAADHRIALVCSEADPESCHRRLLVGKVLTERGLQLHHIRRDGSVEVETEVDLQGELSLRSSQGKVKPHGDLHNRFHTDVG